jgi:hypothetical protein
MMHLNPSRASSLGKPPNKGPIGRRLNNSRSSNGTRALYH